MLEAAVDLAAAGWSVLPCRATGVKAKAPLLAHGHHDASSDPVTIAGWWNYWPDALIGAVVPRSLLVLDIDPRNGGSLEALEMVTGVLPETLTVWSGRNDGGRHLYFARPPHRLVSTRLPAGVDLKQSGYCIMPPSRHPVTSQSYRWDVRDTAGLTPQSLTALAPAPRHRASLAAGSPGGRIKSVAGLVVAVEKAPLGQRNKTLFWALRRALEEGHDVLALGLLEDAARRSGLSDAEVAATIRSAAQRDARGERR